MSRQERYTHYPRAILWLVRGGEITVDGVVVPVEPFYLSKRPITNLQLEASDTPFGRHSRSPGDDDVAVGVDLETARGYCDWYARVSRKPMRLPTEIEWEYACRGPDSFGLLGMLDDVWEWTAEGVLRGGTDCAARRETDPTHRADDVGFRIARSLR